MKKVLIFTATYNEAENISIFLEKVLSLNLNLDILIVDDDSPDLTGSIIENFMTTNQNKKLIKRKKKRGVKHGP